MADLSVTATSVVRISGPTKLVTLGETVTAGQTAYESKSAGGGDGKWYKADANGSTNRVDGIFLAGGAVDQQVLVQTGGVIAIGATVAVGALYIMSGTAGGIAAGMTNLASDFATGWRAGIVGYGLTTARIQLILANATVNLA